MTTIFRAQPAIAVGIDPRSVTTDDVNGDGCQDLLVANSGSTTVSVRLGVGDGSFTNAADVAVGSPFSVTTANVNGDGRQDLLVANSGSGTVSVLLNTNVTAPTAIMIDPSPAVLGSGGNHVSMQ